MLNIDNDISNWILDNTSIFENIHPNCITLFGMGLNFIIFYILFFENDIKHEFGLLSILLFLRWLADCLDGNIARKYDKKSKFGNFLDTISDMIFSLIMVFYICTQLDSNVAIIILVVLFTLDIYDAIYECDVFNGHDKLKDKCDIKAFMVNNSFIYFIIGYLAVTNIYKPSSFQKIK